MTNLLEARILQRLGLMAGVFLIWPVAFFALVRSVQTTAEILVLVPVVVSAMLSGVRGGLVGSLTDVPGIGSAANVALSRLVAFDRVSLYMFDSARGTAKIGFTSGEDHVGPARGDEFSIEEIMAIDHGLRISKPDQDKLFAPFFRSTNPEALPRTGTGLGLVLAKSIVEEHDGNLRVSSELGAGSTFTVELPLRMNVEESLSA